MDKSSADSNINGGMGGALPAGRAGGAVCWVWPAVQDGTPPAVSRCRGRMSDRMAA